MIVPMKKATLLCLAHDRAATLDALRGLGGGDAGEDLLPELHPHGEAVVVHGPLGVGPQFVAHRLHPEHVRLVHEAAPRRLRTRSYCADLSARVRSLRGGLGLAVARSSATVMAARVQVVNTPERMARSKSSGR